MENNILKDTQHGFRKKRGTNTALTTIYETIVHHTAKKKQCYLVLRDVSKTFDKVWFDELKTKILQSNLPNITMRFLINFLIKRKAKIRIDNYTGPSFMMTAGVPQSSSLSPTLYTIHVYK